MLFLRLMEKGKSVKEGLLVHWFPSHTLVVNIYTTLYTVLGDVFELVVEETVAALLYGTRG